MVLLGRKRSRDVPHSSPVAVPVVGGIYTVIRSKAAVTTAELGDQYCMIGPYHEPTVRLEVEVMEPDFPVIRDVVEGMKNDGVKVSLGSVCPCCSVWNCG